MQEIRVNFKKLSPDANNFVYSRKNDACMDMFANINTVLEVGETKIISTGIAVELPHNFEGIVRGRSGLASKGIWVHIGTIDETYRGDIGVIMTNLSKEPFVINKHMRIAQFTVKPVYDIYLNEVAELSKTERGENGYGSSGI